MLDLDKLKVSAFEKRTLSRNDKNGESHVFNQSIRKSQVYDPKAAYRPEQEDSAAAKAGNCGLSCNCDVDCTIF